MKLSEALEKKIIIKDEHGDCKYNGKCKECKHSKQYSYPASSNMCMNEKSEWFGAYHVNYDFNRYVDGCTCFES
ncbi:hypothetical protein CLOBY_27310 [Clostridium saccharobutylicum]|uniref:hypothetical protein n=1 Tax=Clostridium saccharobutylicum TaxID=169679 RepID=UPI000983DBBB|nr:hypothetical protein [Clostridium saccharobutylicum]AQS10586.1 hypothetical protein CLOBY_27310 [Clostridium saccharobutylicum]MBC2438059.1 hypothetical protein [Clostridium saccharobutylicum]NSB90486.1 translation initiation factor 2 gamma subunit (eIF-2gamma) [Clostridium saccharobutylicum]NYC31541.1 translation initiation factor 2 gamma subunit (eIF-2gamma) [Clostridium saccharobutylicum]OOM18859.1 hypothetical protein CLSAB_03170 [Clostridium saccharobutylicum]